MEQCSIYCVTLEADRVADILEKNDKRIKVVMVNMDVPLTLTRNDTRQPYIGKMAGLEFETFGELDA